MVLEQRGGEWNRMSWETLAAASKSPRAGTAASAVVLGHGVGALADELATKQLDKVYAVEHELLKDYTADGYTAALEATDPQSQRRRIVLFPHTYQVRDFAPKLATRFGQRAGQRRRSAAASKMARSCSCASFFKAS